MKIHIARGFPQGGVASAKFWLVAFDDAIQIINSEFVLGNGYADDCCVLFGGRKPEILVKRLQRIIDKLVGWGSSCGLRFNPDKTVVVHFSRKKGIKIPHLRVGNTFVPYSNSAVYLGIHLDAKLFWRIHLNDRIARSKKYLMKMTAISKAIWGPSPKLARWVWRCIVRPMFTYASIIWTHSLDKEKLHDQLRHINRLAMNTYTMFPRSLPTRGLELLLDTFPLHLWLEKEALAAYIRLAKQLELTWSGRNNNKTRNIAHRRYWVEKVDQHNLSMLLLEIDTCSISSDRQLFKIRQDSFHSNQEFYENLYKTDWDIFTDGSKKEGQVGSAFIIYRNGSMDKEASEMFRLPNSSTVFQAELYAIYQAVVWVRENLSSLNPSNSFRFYSDSMSALQSLGSLMINTILGDRTIKQLNLLSEIALVELVWIKAHANNARNEEVDKLAKAATEMTFISYVALPRSFIRQEILEKLREQWAVEWLLYDEARHTKLFILESDKSRGKAICNLDRITLRRLLLAITNHNYLRYHQAFRDDTINPTCRFCHMYDETFDHFFSCHHFIEQRKERGIMWKAEMNMTWKLEEILNIIDIPEIQQAIDTHELTHINTETEVDVPETASEESDVDMDENDDQ